MRVRGRVRVRVRARAHLLDEAGKMLVAAGGGEGPGHADEDGGAVAERLCQVEVVCQVEPLSLSLSPSLSLSLSLSLPLPLTKTVIAPRHARVCRARACGHAARLSERQHGRLDVRHRRRTLRRIGRQLEEKSLDLLVRLGLGLG